jgi:hemerythrin
LHTVSEDDKVQEVIDLLIFFRKSRLNTNRRFLDMPQLEWNDEMSLKIAELDEQHKEWIKIHNRLHDVLTRGAYREVEKIALETLLAMQDYTRMHFKFEEEYMQKIDFPELIEHRRIHRDFDNRIYQFYRDMMNGDMVLNSAIMKTIKNWLVDHIMKEDKKIRHFLESTTTT